MRPALQEHLSTRQLAESLGVSESSVKRWVDDGEIVANRTAGGHRRIPVASAVRFMRRHRLGLQRPESMAFSSAPALGPIDAAAADACSESLLKDDAPGARAIITGRYIAGADIGAIGDGLIRPALGRLGELWKNDPHGILVEHRAVDTCVRVLAELLNWLPLPPPDAPVAITAAGPGDPYLLPPMLASMTLQERGIQARNLGPSTPLDTIGLAAERYRASLCSLSVSAPPERKRHADWGALADKLERGRTRLVVGGRCVSALSTELLGRVPTCASMSELGAYAAGIVHGGGFGPKANKERRR